MRRCFIFVLSALLFSTASSATESTTHFESKYSNLTHCKTVYEKSAPKEAPGEGGSSKDLCPGLDGYKVYIVNEHIYSYLVLQKGKDVFRFFSQSEKVNGPILSAGKLEWRYKNENGNKKLIAWIYRVAGEDLKNETLDRIKRPLQVIRLEPENRKYCLLGEADSNEEAQKLADSDKGCGGVSPFGLY